MSDVCPACDHPAHDELGCTIDGCVCEHAGTTEAHERITPLWPPTSGRDEHLGAWVAPAASSPVLSPEETESLRAIPTHRGTPVRTAATKWRPLRDRPVCSAEGR